MCASVSVSVYISLCSHILWMAQLHLAGFAHFQFNVNTSPGRHLGILCMLTICSCIIIIFTLNYNIDIFKCCMPNTEIELSIV